MGKKRVLAIDDNAVNLAAVEQLLQEEYEVVPMISGRRALKYLERHPADLVLLDIQMPEMSGPETLQELRRLENGAEIPVIYLTALQESEEQEYAMPGVVGFIVKPFDREELKKRVAAALEL